MSTQSFADLGVSNAVVAALSARGITTPFPVQHAVIGDVLAGRDVLAPSPTGSGKTLAFGIPVIDRTAAEARRPAAHPRHRPARPRARYRTPSAGSAAAIGIGQHQ